MKTMEDLATLINDGWDIKIYNQAKRMDAGNGYREFVLRVCWKALMKGEADGVKDKLVECDWEGFENAEDAIADLIDKMCVPA